MGNETVKPADEGRRSGDQLSLVERLRNPWHHSDCRAAADEIQRMRGEQEVLRRWMFEALLVLETAEALEDFEDGGEHIRMLRDRGRRLVEAVRQPFTPVVPKQPDGTIQWG